MSPTTIPGNLLLKNGMVITGREAGPADPYIGNVSLLLHGDGANGSTTIVDSSPSPKTVTPVGNAQISTAQSKFGGSSIAFDGNGDFLQSSANTDFEFGTGQFTVEAWVYFSVVSNVNEFITVATDSINGRWTLYYNGGTFFTGATGGAGGTTCSFTPQANTWYHIAVSRDNSNNQRIFIGGDLKANAVSTNNYTQSGLRVGRSVAGTTYLTGYIDDLRITKGVARYTANFTPPTAPFPDI